MSSIRSRALRNIGRAVVQSAWRAAEREAALRGVAGFDEVWSRTSAVPGWFGETEASGFWAVMQATRPSAVVEIGSYQGRSTTFLGLALKALAIENATLIAIDPHTGDRQNLERLSISTVPTLDMFRVHTAAAGITDILSVKVQTSDDAAVGWTQDISLLFIDGWHSYGAVISDARNFCAHLTQNGMVCFDDYGGYADVRQAVDDVCRELHLNFYGVVGSQAWAGRPAECPAGLNSAIRVSRIRRRLAALSRSA